jgi:hypothetical protein
MASSTHALRQKTTYDLLPLMKAFKMPLLEMAGTSDESTVLGPKAIGQANLPHDLKFVRGRFKTSIVDRQLLKVGDAKLYKRAKDYISISTSAMTTNDNVWIVFERKGRKIEVTEVPGIVGGKSNALNIVTAMAVKALGKDLVKLHDAALAKKKKV